MTRGTCQARPLPGYTEAPAGSEIWRAPVFDLREGGRLGGLARLDRGLEAKVRNRLRCGLGRVMALTPHAHHISSAHSSEKGFAMPLTRLVPVRSGHSASQGLLVVWSCVLLGCASSGDVDRLRTEQEQAKAKMSAELAQEQKLLADIERSSATQRASAEKLASALAGSTGSRPPASVVSVCQASNASAPSVEFWVSPRGHDAGPGTRQEPFKTLERAREAVFRVEPKQWEGGDVVVSLEDGVYRLDRPFVLHDGDSGRHGHDVVYRAAPGAKPVLAGSIQVTGWTLHDRELNIYKASVGQVRSRQLYVNGRRAVRARTDSYPAGFQPRAVRPSNVEAGMPYPAGGGIFYAKTDLNPKRWQDPSTWTNVQDIEAVGKDQWRMAIVPLASVTSAQGLGLMTLQQPGWTNANITTTPIWNFWQVERFENALEFLDEPGEWYLKTTKDGNELYYMPRPGEDLAVANVELPWLEVLIEGHGKSESPLSHLRFEGLTFAYATWMGPSSGNGYVPDQSGFLLVGSGHHPSQIGHNKDVVRTPGNLSFLYASHVTFRQNRFEHLGAVALDFSTGSKCNRIRDNGFLDISSAAIQLGGVSDIDHPPLPQGEPHVTSDNYVENNVIKETGREFVDAAGIFVGFTRNTVIEHNTISDVPWSGIAIGWGWGLLDESGFPGVPGASWHAWGRYPRTPNSGNKIRYNLIERFLGDRWDGGAIYTTGQQGQSPADPLLIEGNVAIAKRPSGGGNTFYTDGGSRYIKLKSNVSLNNPIGHMDFGLPPRPGDPLPYVEGSFPVAAINKIPYGSDTGGCVTYGELVYEDNYWLEGAMPRQELFIGVFDLVTTSVLSWFDPKLAPFDPYSAMGFFDICPYTDKATGIAYPTQLTYSSNHMIKGRDDVPKQILDNAGVIK